MLCFHIGIFVSHHPTAVPIAVFGIILPLEDHQCVLSKEESYRRSDSQFFFLLCLALHGLKVLGTDDGQ